MRNGYIAIDRGIFDHPMFKDREDWHVAWEKLIAAAAWKARGVRGGWGVVHVERGQLAATLRTLGMAWGWPKSNVDCFLKRLAREDMVMLEKTRTTTRTSSRTLAHPVTIITICNYEKFQGAGLRSQNPGQQPGQQPGQALQETLPLQGLPPSQPANQQTIVEEGVDKTGEKCLARSARTKPPHGAKGRGMVWFDHGSSEWELYAADYRETRGADLLPENRAGGRGNWFVLLGEASAPSPRRRRAGGGG
jgi:hypothetical protein